MDNIYPMPIATNSEPLDDMYPDIYKDIYPLVNGTVNEMLKMGYGPSPDVINSAVEHILRNSGLWDEDDDYLSIPVQNGFENSHFRRRRRGHHNRNSLRDLIRILLLRELFGRNGHR